MGMLHLHQLSRNAYRRADRIIANKPKYQANNKSISTNTTPQNNVEYETFNLHTKLHIFFKIADEIVLSNTDRQNFSSYCKDEIADNYSQALDFELKDNNLVEVIIDFTFPYELDEDNGISPKTEKKLNQFVADITSNLESDLPFVMVHKLHIAMRNIQHEYRKESIIEITTDGGIERIIYDNRSHRMIDKAIIL